MTNPTMTSIGKLMDSLKGDKTRIASISIAPRGGSLAHRIRDGKADQRVPLPPPELVAFNDLMARINKHYGKRLTDGVLLRAIGTVALHTGCLIGEVRRMTFTEFNAAIDEAMGQPAKPQKRVRNKGASVEQCMAAMLTKDPALMGWPASKWAERLGVTAAAVKQTNTWKVTIKGARALCQARRINRGR